MCVAQAIQPQAEHCCVRPDIHQPSAFIHLTRVLRGDLVPVQGYKPDYMYLLQRMMMDNPEAAVNLAKMVAKQPGPPIELNTMADLFLQRNMVREATAFLLEVLQENKPEQDKLQTKVGY